jgi:hypothetical protein
MDWAKGSGVRSLASNHSRRRGRGVQLHVPDRGGRREASAVKIALQTLARHRVRSEKGKKRRFGSHSTTADPPRLADILRASRHVSKVARAVREKLKLCEER